MKADKRKDITLQVISADESIHKYIQELKT